MPKRFIVHPGHITSKNDGQRHYIGAVQLMRLYGVDARDCIVEEATTLQRRHATEQGIKFYHLSPQFDGNYSLRTAMAEQS